MRAQVMSVLHVGWPASVELMSHINVCVVDARLYRSDTTAERFPRLQLPMAWRCLLKIGRYMRLWHSSRAKGHLQNTVSLPRRYPLTLDAC